MNTRKSNDEPQVNRSQTTEEQSQAMNTDRPGDHYVKHHGFSPDAFAEDGETTQFTGILVVNESESASVQSAWFADFRLLKQSNWTVNYDSAARLSDGNILYEGEMDEHAFAGMSVTLEVDGEQYEVELEDGISTEEGEEYINSMLGLEAPTDPTEVDHPDLEFADIPADETPVLEGFRTLCRLDGCHETEVFDSLDAIKESEWTELEFGIGFLTDNTDLHYGYCPGHSLTEEEGYEPEKDPGSTEYPVPWEQSDK